MLDLAGERNGDMVVKSPVAIPVSLQPLGRFRQFSRFAHGYAQPTSARSGSTPNGAQRPKPSTRNLRATTARPRYDRTNSALRRRAGGSRARPDSREQFRRTSPRPGSARALARHRRDLRRPGRATTSPPKSLRRKLPVLVNLKWPEAEKDADPDDVPTSPHPAFPRSRPFFPRGTQQGRREIRVLLRRYRRTRKTFSRPQRNRSTRACPPTPLCAR